MESKRESGPPLSARPAEPDDAALAERARRNEDSNARPAPAFRPDLFWVLEEAGEPVGLCRVELGEGEVEVRRVDWIAGGAGESSPAPFGERDRRLIETLRGASRERGGAALTLRTPRDEVRRRGLEQLGFALREARSREWVFEDRAASDERWMGEALGEAVAAGEAGETPVGAVIVRGGAMVGRGRNAVERENDATAHAELLAIREASRAVGDGRLEGCELFVTVEPCAMCAGAAIHARLARVVFGAANEKFGAVGSRVDLLSMDAWTRRIAWRGGVRGEESTALLRRFFEERRGG